MPRVGEHLPRSLAETFALWIALGLGDLINQVERHQGPERSTSGAAYFRSDTSGYVGDPWCLETIHG